MTVLVLGGTGFVGRALAAAMVERTGVADLTVPTRRLAHGQALQVLPGVELAEANVHDDRALARLAAGKTAVVNLIAILHGSRADFERVHVALPRRLAAACRASGVRRVVHVSALGVSADAPSMYLRSKAAGEAALRDGALDLTILRPSVMFGAEDQSLNLFAQLQAVMPVLALAGGGSKMQPVWVGDVAQAIIRCLDDASTIGQTIECAGPNVLTLAEIVRLAGRWSGSERAIVPLPDSLARLQALVFELLPGRPLLSRDNLDSLKVPNVASGKLPGLARLGIIPTALESVAPAYLAPHRGRGRLDALRSLARR